MRRQFAIAALLAGLVLPSTLHAQFRGGARAAAPRAPSPPRMGGGFSGFRSSGFRSAPSPMRSGGFRSGPIRTAPFREAGRRPGGFHGRPGPFPPRFFPHRRRFVQSQFFSGFGFPTTYFYAFPPYYGQLGDNDGWTDQIPAAAAAEPEQSGQDDALVNQVQELTDEVASLREQGSGPSPRTAATPQAGFEEKSVPAVFVYHDGHQLEAQNYAILGQTLWVFGDEITRKVPLASLDLAQTRKMNDERGIDFNPPELR